MSLNLSHTAVPKTFLAHSRHTMLPNIPFSGGIVSSGNIIVYLDLEKTVDRVFHTIMEKMTLSSSHIYQ